MPVTAKDRPDIQFLIDEYKTVRGLVNHDPKIPSYDVTRVALALTAILLRNKDVYLDNLIADFEVLHEKWRAKANVVHI